MTSVGYISLGQECTFGTYAIGDTTTSSVWMTTAALGYDRPHGLASDDTYLYVTCHGTTGSDGAVLRIHQTTKAVTVIESGTQYPKQGIDLDSAGNVYWADGPNNDYGGSPSYAGAYRIRKWDGSTVSTVISDQGFFTLSLAGDRIHTIDSHSFQHKSSGHRGFWYWRLTTAGVTEINGDPSGHFDAAAQWRGMTINGTEAVVTDGDDSSIVFLDTATAGLNATVTGFANPQSIHMRTPADSYVLGMGGGIRRINLATRTLGTTLSTGLPTSGGFNGYGDLHISPSGRCFVARGGVQAHTGATYPTDNVAGSDVGIYEVETTWTC